MIKKSIRSADGRMITKILLCLLMLLVLLAIQSCDFSWHDIWSREDPSADENVFVDRADAEEDTDIIFNDSVEYNGDVHAGTEICYNGQGKLKKYIIVIDPGHQQKANNEPEPIGPGATETKPKVSGGAESARQTEYNLNLQVALNLRDILIDRGYSIVMIRETNDVNISNAERAEIANKYDADVFIRIHANGSNDTSIRGVQALCTSADNPFPCVSTYKESRKLSELLLNAYCEETGLTRLSIVESDVMSGINWSEVPTVIFEMGFMSNDAEDGHMASNFFRRNAARGLANGIDEYIEHIINVVEYSSAEVTAE